MDWIVATDKGVFEGKTKRQVVKSMVEHYGVNDQDPDTITAIYLEKKNGKTDELCQKLVGKIQDLVDEGVAEWRKTAAEEYRGQKQIESDYRASIL